MITSVADRGKRIEDLADQTLQRPFAERTLFLDQVCGSDTAIRTEVVSLLAQRAQISGGNNAPESSAAGQVFEQRFVLVRPLGEGGMGLVWLADQIAPVRRPVALKLIRAAMYDEAVLRRFQSERQSLAIMEHPAIAKVFEAGATSQGQPYFVMEYVPGRPINEYCDQRKLSIAERLELFIQVCEGVQHAHQKAIIHRDLKPPNILVMEVDGKAVPRIIDFGLAKATMPHFADETEVTLLGQFMGTPGYMSPEQVVAQDIDTRTDVYALGVILYSLLAGSLPFDVQPPRRQTFDELLRRLREEEPPRPSTKISANRETAAAIAAARGIGSKQLVNLLRADLDWIALKALERDRERRYGTPTELAADLRRYLNHEPILARPDSVGYQLRKFIRRNRLATAVVGMVSVLAIIAAGSGLIAIRQRNLALAEQTAADHTANFMVSLFKIADPGESGGNSVTVRTLLDRGAAQISEGLETEPVIRADLLTAMGQAYSGIGLYDPAKKLLALADADQQANSPSAESRVRTLDAAGANLVLAADYDHAAQLLKEAVRIARLKLPAQSELRSRSLDDLADVQSQLEIYGEAESLCREALKADRKRGPEGQPVLARTLEVLGAVYYFSGKLPAAESALRESVAIEQRTFGERDAKTAMTLNNLAAVLYQEGDYDASVAIWQKALSIYREVYGPDHPQVALILNNAGRGALMSGRIDDAEALLRQALATMDEKLKDSDHDTLVPILNSLSMIDGYRGNFAKAHSENERAERIARLPNHGEMLDQVLLNRADLELRAETGRHAGETLAESRRLLEPRFPITQAADSWRYALWDTVNAEWLAQQSDMAAARRTMAAAIPVIEKRFGATGFQSLLARRRAEFIDTQASDSAPKR